MTEAHNVGTKLQLRPPTSHRLRRPRIQDFDYTGQYCYHVILVTKDRRRVFSIKDDLASSCVEILGYLADELRFLIRAYCFMPDHLHLLVQGGTQDSNLVRFVQRFKQTTSFQYKSRFGTTLWQQSFFDRVLRRDEAIEEVGAYIFANPVQGGLVTDISSYPLIGGSLLLSDAAEDAAEATSLRVPTKNRAAPHEVTDD